MAEPPAKKAPAAPTAPAATLAQLPVFVRVVDAGTLETNGADYIRWLEAPSPDHVANLNLTNLVRALQESAGVWGARPKVGGILPPGLRVRVLRRVPGEAPTGADERRGWDFNDDEETLDMAMGIALPGCRGRLFVQIVLPAPQMENFPVFVGFQPDGAEFRYSQWIVAPIYSVLVVLRKFELLTMLKGCYQFCADLPSFDAIENCSVFVLRHVAGALPTPEEDAAAVELQVNDTFGMLLGCDLSRRLFIRVVFPPTAQPESFVGVEDASKAPDYVFKKTIGTPIPLPQVVVLLARLQSTEAPDAAMLERATHFTRILRNQESSGLGNGGAAGTVSLNTHKLYEVPYTARAAIVFERLAHLRCNCLGVWVHQVPTFQNGGVCDMIYCVDTNDLVAEVPVLVEAVSGPANFAKVQQGGHYVTNTLRMAKPQGQPFVRLLIHIAFVALGGFQVEIWVHAGFVDLARADSATRACIFRETAADAALPALLLRVERALGEFGDAAIRWPITAALFPRPIEQSHHRVWIVGDGSAAGPVRARKLLCRQGAWRTLSPEAWRCYIGMLNGAFVTRSMAADTSADAAAFASSSGAGAALTFAGTRDMAAYAPESVYVEYDFVEGLHVPTTAGHIASLVAQLHALHAGLPGTAAAVPDGGAVVHGDLRWTNCVCCADGSARLIDFDFAGLAGHGRYPLGYNREVPDTRRHPDAVEGGLLQPIHDCFSLAWMARCYAPLGQAVLGPWEQACAAVAVGELPAALALFGQIPPGTPLRALVTLGEAQLTGTGSPPQV